MVTRWIEWEPIQCNSELLCSLVEKEAISEIQLTSRRAGHRAAKENPSVERAHDLAIVGMQLALLQDFIGFRRLRRLD